MFENFLTGFKQRLQQKLPGESAQYLMAPAVRRPIPPEFLKDYKPRASGVLILIYPFDSKLYTVLMQRPEYEGAHSNQISLPGGKREAYDNNITETAIREAKEEIGIDPEKLELIGSLTNLYVPPSNFCISPAVAFIHKKPVFNIEPKEVAGLIEVPLEKLTDKNIVKSKIMKLFGGFEIETPYYDIDGNIVWGATAMILSEFIYILNEMENREKGKGER